MRYLECRDLLPNGIDMQGGAAHIPARRVEEMLRLLRLAAVLGLVLALVEFGWAIVEARENFRSRISVTAGYVWLLRDLHGPCWWFGLSGILYTITDMALLRRAQHQVTNDEKAPRGIRQSPPHLTGAVRG
jgi:hypothetical protein